MADRGAARRNARANGKAFRLRGGRCLIAESASAIAGPPRKRLRLQRNSLPPRRILLVEDSEANRFLVLAYLKNTSYQIDIAENGLVALVKLKSKPYDLVLMDLEMPEMDGYTATRRIPKMGSRKSGAGRLPSLP